MLIARQRYFWTVQVWDDHNQMTTSRVPSWFEMGLLASSDWSARWIGAPDTSVATAASLPWIWIANQYALKAAPREAVTFRYALTLAALPSRASLSIATHGDFTATVNGQRTGLKKDWSAFDNEDLRPHLHVGVNDILITVTAPALRNGPPGAPPNPSAPKTVIAGLAALLRLTAADGTTRRVSTADPAWQAAPAVSNTFAPAAVVAPLNDPRLGTAPGYPAEPATLLRTNFTAANPATRPRL